jgi:flagellar motor switch protein FliN/FliY
VSDMLSQAEIDALLSGATESDAAREGAENAGLSAQEIDALGEIGNISMGTSATTLFTLLGHKVTITTPDVAITTWEELTVEYDSHFIGVIVEYTRGLTGTNLLILKEDDVKVITDLMMGGDGRNTGGELGDLHLSAIGEAMNQMIGSAATSLSSMFNKKISISPPKAFILDFDNANVRNVFNNPQQIVSIAFKMVVEGLIDSEIMQLIPIKFAKSMVENLLNINLNSEYAADIAQLPRQPEIEQAVGSKPPEGPQAGFYKKEVETEPFFENPVSHNNDYGNAWHVDGGNEINKVPVNVRPAEFQPFGDDHITIEKKNIGLIMDVPLQVTVELGRTSKLIKDILELGTGSIIELDKLAGDTVDILVNGKAIAKGEVVVIDESFGVRISDIIHPSKRL